MIITIQILAIIALVIAVFRAGMGAQTEKGEAVVTLIIVAGIRPRHNATLGN